MSAHRPGSGRLLRGDEGRITILVLGYFVVIAVLLGVVVGVASVQTERQRLFAVADAAALDAADALAVDAYFRDGLGVDGAPGAAAAGAGAGAVAVPLTDASVRASVEAYLGAVGAAGRFEGLTVSALTGTPDGSTAQVVLSAVATPAMLPRVVDERAGGVPITVTARARASEG